LDQNSLEPFEFFKESQVLKGMPIVRGEQKDDQFNSVAKGDSIEPVILEGWERGHLI